MKRLSVLVVLLFAMTAAASAQVLNDWAGIDDAKWNVAANWSLGTVPQDSTFTTTLEYALIKNGTSAILDSDQTALLGQLGQLHVYGDSTLKIQDGANLVMGNYGGAASISVASNFGPITPSSGEIIQTGGTVHITWGLLNIGQQSSGTMTVPNPVGKYTISGGSFSNIPSSYSYIGGRGTGELHVDGGAMSLQCNSTVGTQKHLYVGGGVGDDLESPPPNGLIEMTGGTLEACRNNTGGSSAFYVGGGTSGTGYGVGTLDISGGVMTIGGRITVGTRQGTGAVIVRDTGHLIWESGSDFGSNVGINQTLLVSGGTLDVLTTVTNYGIRMSRNAGIISTATISGGVLNIEGKGYTASGAFEIGGNGFATVNQTGGLVYTEAMSLGRRDGEGTYNLHGGILKTRNGSGSYANAITRDGLTLNGAVLKYNGTSNFNWDGGMLLISGSTDIGKAIVNGGGTLSPYYEAADKSATSDVGIVEFIGGYQVTSANAVLAINANGATTPGVDYDQVRTSANPLFAGTTGDVVLAGKLVVTLGYAPAAGDVLTIIDPNSTTTGTLAGAAGGTEPITGCGTYGKHQYWAKIRYNGGAGNDVELYDWRRLVRADGDSSGLVDQNDYTPWYYNYGLSGKTWAQGNYDLDANGLIDMTDYQEWYDYYGQSAAGAGEVPEPATMGLLALGAVALLRRRR